MFQSLQEGLQTAFQVLRGKGKLTESNMREGLAMVEKSMVEADVNVDVVRKFMADVSEAAIGRRVIHSLRPNEELVKIVYEQLVDLLGPVDNSIPLQRGAASSIMMCGLQGAGKTTTCGKLSQLIKEQGFKPFLIAADLQRPAAIEQLHVLNDTFRGLHLKSTKSRPHTVHQHRLPGAGSEQDDGGRGNRRHHPHP